MIDMCDALIAEIDKKIEQSRDAVVADIIRLVNIPSEQGTPLPGAPFGEGPKNVLDEVLKMGKAEGFFGTDYGVGVVSVAMKEGQPDVGIWVHGDVVPAGDGWTFEPYNAREYGGCIIGRGVTDNKGQLVAVFYVLKILKDMGIDLHYNPAIYVGSNEETGMADLVGLPDNPDVKGFLNVCAPPRLSLVPDSSFPVGYGGKGIVNITLKSNKALKSCVFDAAKSASPGSATAVFNGKELPKELPLCTIEKDTVTAFTPPRHGASPDPDGNMVTNICTALLENNLIAEEERGILEFFKQTSLDIYGEKLSIATKHPVLGELTVFINQIDYQDGYPEITLNIRYPLGITYEEIVKNTQEQADRYGFSLVMEKAGSKPYLLDPETDTVKLLADIANSVTGENKPPYTLKGGTYAHRLPNAYVFGTDCNVPPADFSKGRGGAHGVDEAASVDKIIKTMKIYARTLLALN
ncbi:MAG: Sapep family Mn(2+)-dependent dipeptidase [Clostridia bacterium]|nr:Sapep family Mn(2+)-dependent dipeptidase [Clostridia bacterium]